MATGQIWAHFSGVTQMLQQGGHLEGRQRTSYCIVSIAWILARFCASYLTACTLVFSFENGDTSNSLHNNCRWQNE